MSIFLSLIILYTFLECSVFSMLNSSFFNFIEDSGLRGVMIDCWYQLVLRWRQTNNFSRTSMTLKTNHHILHFWRSANIWIQIFKKKRNLQAALFFYQYLFKKPVQSDVFRHSTFLFCTQLLQTAIRNNLFPINVSVVTTTTKLYPFSASLHLYTWTVYQDIIKCQRMPHVKTFQH